MATKRQSQFSQISPTFLQFKAIQIQTLDPYESKTLIPGNSTALKALPQQMLGHGILKLPLIQPPA